MGKKRNYATVLLFIFPFALTADVIEKTYNFSEYRIEKKEDYHTIQFNNTLLEGRLGEPLLPYHPVFLLLPPGEIAESIEIIEGKRENIQGQFRMYPKQPARTNTFDPDKLRFFKKNSVYLASDEYPSTASGRVKTYFMNGFGFAVTTVTPLRYLPAEDNVSFYKNLTVRIHTRPDTKSHLKNLNASEKIVSRIQKIAQNPDIVSRYRRVTNNGDSYQMLIVTGAQFETAFQQLVDHYRLRGVDAQIVSVETIDSAIPGQDTPERIRNYIIQEYREHSIEFVLLGGDVEIVPYRGFYCQVESDVTYTYDDIPADLYYSALDVTWDSDGDNIWGELGEDEEDLLPDVAVGRFPVSNFDELDNMIHKTISYQNTPVLGELRKPFLVGELAWNDPLTWGGDYLDLLVGTHDDNGYTTIGIPYNHDIEYLYDRDHGTWGTSTLISRINEGSAYIYHWGHSNAGYNMRLNMGNITNANFADVNGVDHNYANIWSHGCSSCAFNLNDCIGEKMVTLENFAVSYIGFSHLGFSNEGQTEGPTPHLNREYVNTLYGRNIGQIGLAHLFSKLYSAPWVNTPDEFEEGAFRWCFYSCNLLGDPAMPIWTDEPMTLQMDYQQIWTNDEPVFSIHMISDGNPVEGLNCVITKNDTVLGKGTSQANGTLEIPMEAGITDLTNVELYVSGYNCLLTAFPFDFSRFTLDENYQPEKIELLQNYPNPFNPETTIQYAVADDSHIKLDILNTKGQLVQTLVDENQNKGIYSKIWNGMDQNQNRVASGVYICVLRDGHHVKKMKIVLKK